MVEVDSVLVLVGLAFALIKLKVKGFLLQRAADSAFFALYTAMTK
jgi:hypothetical protein